MQYHFILKDNNQKAHNGFKWFLFFLHIVAAAWAALQTPDDKIKWDMYILLGVYGLISICHFIFRKNNEVLEAFSLALTFFYAYFWLKLAGIIASLISVLIFLFATVVKGKKTTVSFSETGVYLKRVFKTLNFPWTELDNVILKDGLLSIDFISNKLIQSEVTGSNDTIDENCFNSFCAEQLQKKI